MCGSCSIIAISDSLHYKKYSGTTLHSLPISLSMFQSYGSCPIAVNYCECTHFIISPSTIANYQPQIYPMDYSFSVFNIQGILGLDILDKNLNFTFPCSCFWLDQYIFLIQTATLKAIRKLFYYVFITMLWLFMNTFSAKYNRTKNRSRWDVIYIFYTTVFLNLIVQKVILIFL